MTATAHHLSDTHWMTLALAQARLAAQAGEVPVGAVVVHQNTLVASAHNQTLTLTDPSAHAEVLALRQAAQVIGNHRLGACTLYVTLEPCLMCSGAVLTARLQRVVYGAPEPKTGAAGSVLDVFGHAQLNHQTVVNGGVLAEACRTELQAFFQKRRVNPAPLKDDALRTPAACFDHVAEPRWPAHWVSDLPSLHGWRLHYLDEGPRQPIAPAVTWLALHGPQDWSHRFEAVLEALVHQGHRVLVPDLIGFGRSDKPKKTRVHQRGWHLQVLREWMAHVDARRVALLVPDDGHGLGVALSLMEPQRFLARGEWPVPPVVEPDTPAAQSAPYPDRGHRAGPQALVAWRPEPA